MKQPTALIIGAGIGGLATAIKLAKQGFNVTIVEKNKHPGGRCQQIVQDGHIFDTGPTMYLFPRLYSDYFDSIGEDITTYIQLLKTNPTYRLHFSDNTHLTLSENFEEMKNQLEQLEPGSYDRFLKYLEVSKEHYDIAMNTIIHKRSITPLHYMTPKTLYRLLKSKALKPHISFINEFFKHPHLQAAFSFQDSYLSLHPFEAPAIFSMFSYSELTEGSYLPQGGMSQVIMALEKIAIKNRVTIRYNSPVKNILIAGKLATGLQLEDDSIHLADYVVVNADLTYAYQHLLPHDHAANTLLSKQYSCSAIVYHWGLKKNYPQLKTHNLFFAPSYKQGFDEALKRSEPPQQPHFYIQAPTRTDPSRAPNGEDTLSIMVPINHIAPDNPVEWDTYADSTRRYIINRLEQAGLKDIEQQIKFEIRYLPTDWERYLNLPFGAIYGLHHNLTQLGCLRPNRQHQKYKNVFFVGASTHPGSGLPTILLSTHYTSEKIRHR